MLRRALLLAAALTAAHAKPLRERGGVLPSRGGDRDEAGEAVRILGEVDDLQHETDLLQKDISAEERRLARETADAGSTGKQTTTGDLF